MIYFSSDLHFNHDKDFIYKPRGFNNVNEMNQTIIKNFWKIIKPEDDLYLLGDHILGDNLSGFALFKQLPGNIHLIWGNHDTVTRINLLSNCHNVVEVIGYAGIIKYNKYRFYCSHFPTITTNFDDNAKPLNKRLICLAGHTHSKDKFNESCFSYNVCLDAHNNFPVSIDQIILDLKDKYK